MKKSARFILLMFIAVVTLMCLTACGGKKSTPTLESYMNDHPEAREEIDEKLGSSDYAGVTVEFSGNDMIYTFDLSQADGITEEIAKSDDTKAALDSGLAGQKDAFVSTANSVLEAVKADGVDIESVRVIVNYTYDDEVISTATFESDSTSEE